VNAGACIASGAHPLRASLMSYWTARDVRTVQELLGHSHIQTTARHLHSDTRTKQTAVSKLDGLLGSKGGGDRNVPFSDTAADSS